MPTVAFPKLVSLSEVCPTFSRTQCSDELLTDSVLECKIASNTHVMRGVPDRDYLFRRQFRRRMQFSSVIHAGDGFTQSHCKRALCINFARYPFKIDSAVIGLDSVQMINIVALRRPRAMKSSGDQRMNGNDVTMSSATLQVYPGVALRSRWSRDEAPVACTPNIPLRTDPIQIVPILDWHPFFIRSRNRSGASDSGISHAVSIPRMVY